MIDDPHGIGQYYRDKLERQHEAYEVWKKAKEAGADVMVLHKLWEKMIDAGDCGD